MRKRTWILTATILTLLLGFIGLGSALPANASPLAVETSTLTPTKMPTVTGTSAGVLVTVTLEESQVNVRSGPGRTYPKVGVLLAGQQVYAKGRSSGGDWVLVDYPGIEGNEAWVYSYLITIPTGSTLPIVEPPPTPTPAVTATMDQTLAAQFLITVEPTRLPTFTEPAPLTVPTLPGDESRGASGGIPMGLIIVSIGLLGVFLGLVSLFRGR